MAIHSPRGASRASIVACIGVHIMVRQQRAQSVRAFTPTPAGVQFGTQVFALVGTDEHTRLPKPRQSLLSVFHRHENAA